MVDRDHNPNQRVAPRNQSNQGFTLVEILIAGVLLAIVMSTVARLNTQPSLQATPWLNGAELKKPSTTISN